MTNWLHKRHIHRLLISAFILFSAGKVDAGAVEAQQSAKPYRRVISLDFCADQYVLKLLDKSQILAVSPQATKAFSYMAAAAMEVPTVQPRAENILILKPDLVVRSYGGGPNISQFLQRAGVPVLHVGWASDIDGAKLGSIPSVVMRMAKGMGVPDRGAEIVHNYRQKLASLRRNTSAQTLLYMAPAGVTSGPGSMVHQLITLSGYENFQQQAGWRPLPLERLAYEQPDAIAASFFDASTNHPSMWSAARHPVARAQLADDKVIPLKGAWTACGGWFVLDALEALVQKAGPNTAPAVAESK